MSVCFLVAAAGCGPEGKTKNKKTTNKSKRPAGCFGKCDGTQVGYQSSWKADLDKLNEAFPSQQVPIESIEDAYSVVMKLGEQTIKSPTHVFGQAVQVIPYGDDEPVTTAGGTEIQRRDKVIAQIYKPGEVGIAVKHHRPEHRYFQTSGSTSQLKEQFKLQDTHVELPVGVIRDGDTGAITINNPQTYQDGLFGSPTYPMIFFKPTYPEYVPSDRVPQFRKNIRNWLMVFAAVTEFPGQYNGNDPLAAATPEQLTPYVSKAIEAIAGDQSAVDWFDKEENLIYCAELAFVSHNVGVHYPLTEESMVPLVGQETWDKFKEEMEKHNQAVEAMRNGDDMAFSSPPSRFDELNDNDKIKYVELAMDVPGDLEPLWKYAPEGQRSAEKKKLAFAPMTAADLVDQFLRIYIPRREMGEQVAPLQGAFLEKMKPGLYELMGFDQLPDDDPRKVKMDMLFGKIVEVVKKPHEDYETFRANLKPYLDQARKVSSSRPNSDVSFYSPPSLFHSMGKKTHTGGLLGIKYYGHGVHWEHVQKKEQAAGEGECQADVDCGEGEICVDFACEADDSEPENPGANSCQDQCVGQAPGGCWCDQQCENYGDCCEDYNQFCAEN